jgi:hypothetical protein
MLKNWPSKRRGKRKRRNIEYFKKSKAKAKAKKKE